MTISNRLLAFALGALAAVLAGFSLAVYLLVAANAAQQLEDRAVATLDTLAAQCRWRPEGLEWMGDGWDITFPRATEPAIWGVFDAAGQCLETSRDLAFPIASAGAGQAVDSAPERMTWMDHPWVVYRRRIVHSQPAGQSLASPPQGLNPSLTLVTAWPYRGVVETKRNLARFLAIVSVSAWATALVAGRWYCKRALSPLIDMAESVRGIDAGNLSFRLPARETPDELQALTVAFDGLMDRLEEAFVRQSRFVSEASHQLRTPLAALLGQLEVALRRERGAEDYRRTIRISQGVALRLQKIVETLLFLARREGTGPIVEREPVNLTEWVPDHLIRSWSEHPAIAVIRFVNETDGPVTVRTHTAMLGQALDNYLDNALKHGSPGEPVTVRLRVSGGRAMIDVEDHGPGLDEVTLKNAFVPFFRSDEARRRGIEGLGLGLAIVERLAKAIGAEAEAESRAGQGTTFRLVLPVIEPFDAVGDRVSPEESILPCPEAAEGVRPG